MSPPASSQRKRKSSSRLACGRAVITLALAAIMLAGTGQDTAEDRYGASIETITQRDRDPDVVIVALTDAEHSVLNTEFNTETSSVADIAVEPAVTLLVAVRKPVDQQEIKDLVFPGGRRRREFLVADELVEVKLGQASNRHRHFPEQESGPLFLC